eukprot:2376252-Rhodomonas_salina.3
MTSSRGDASLQFEIPVYQCPRIHFRARGRVCLGAMRVRPQCSHRTVTMAFAAPNKFPLADVINGAGVP